MLARERVNSQAMLTHEYITTQGILAQEARKHSTHAGTWAWEQCKARWHGHIINENFHFLCSVNLVTQTVVRSLLNQKLWVLSLSSATNLSRSDSGQTEKINLNFYFHTSLRCLESFYESLKGLHKTSWGTTKKCENKNLNWFLF